MRKETTDKGRTPLESLGGYLEKLGDFEVKAQDCLDRLDYLPDEAYHFRDSARMKLENLLESALDCGGATRGMCRALDGIESEIVRWEEQ